MERPLPHSTGLSRNTPSLIEGVAIFWSFEMGEEIDLALSSTNLS